MGLSGIQLGTESTEMIAFLTRVASPLASEVKVQKRSKEFKILNCALAASR
jgi:hypothetical protein